MTTTMTRRSAMRLLASSTLAGMTTNLTRAAFDSRKRTGMGLVIYDCIIRRRWMQNQHSTVDLFEPLTFLKHCQALDAGGMQAKLGVMTADDILKLRAFAEQHGLYIDAIVKAPTSKADVSRFAKEIETARDVGVQAARTAIIPGRRYERFKTLDEFREFERRGREMLERAAAVVEKQRVPLAVENHKDQRIDERVALFKHLDSEYIGACVDTGNSFALLDGAYEPVEALAPYAFTVHLKDQALREYSDGFLLGDIPLGQGSFDLKKIVETIKKAKPNVRFSLELITRDPLKVPCLTDQYFATMPSLPGIDVARAMQFVREHTAKHLQQVTSLPIKEQVELEDANIASRLKYARDVLDL